MKKYKSIYEKIVDQEISLKSLIYLQLIFVGIILNLFAFSANDGRMPVFTEYHFSDERHFSFREFNEVRQPYLTDIIDLYWAKASIGDLFIFIGSFFSVGNLIWTSLRKKKLIEELEWKNKFSYLPKSFN